ncbi:type VII secretion protein EccB [Gulosibacter hominis]|uniref:type VII secretion protein EccB n=1 Tax=Gulosibacter hominis TaxID=2770504 RepID=UPI001917A592|nr:type VII secretion protein EccB [Gulosibacter hominis]
MASSKDILDAQRFNKRRLVSAFTSGTPGGREIELKSPIGPLIVGVILTIIILVAAWIWGRFAPALPNDWQNGMLVTEKDTGARYYSIDGKLHPIRNTTSARLLSQSGDLSRTSVEASALAGIPRGPEVGITGAPDAVPTTAQLQNDGWLACPVADGAEVQIGGDPQYSTSATGALVQHGEDIYLLAEGRRYLIDPEEVTAVRLAFGWEGVEPVEVGSAWLDLFDEGTVLRPWQFDNAGASAGNLRGPLADAKLGTVVEVPDGQGIRQYLITGDRELVPLTPVEYRLYLVGGGAQYGNPIRASLADIADLTSHERRLGPSDWPVAVPEMPVAGAAPCALLTSRGGKVFTTVVQAAPPEAVGVEVEGGTGALVRITSGGTLGAVYLVGDSGKAYGIEGPADEVVTWFGYQPGDITNIPAAWLQLLPAGPVLSAEAAWATVPQDGAE